MSGTGSLFTIGANAALTLEDVTLKGVNNNTAPLVQVQTNGALVLRTGGKITENTFNASVTKTGGAGVLVDGGTLEIAGGEVSGNTLAGTFNGTLYGGGVLAKNGSTVTMNAGAIRNNTITNIGAGDGPSGGGGGIMLLDGASFEMINGIIEGNNVVTGTSGGNGGAYGGGIYVYNSNFRMQNGTIRNNDIRMTTGNSMIRAFGGGVFLFHESSFIMEGGVINGNSCNTPLYPANTQYWSNPVILNGAYGGGVHFESFNPGTNTAYSTSVILKTGGVIYGSEAAGNDADGIPLANTAQSTSTGVGGGHAIFMDDGASEAKYRRNSTAGAANNIRWSLSGAKDGWE
jgi:hypothetical protein